MLEVIFWCMVLSVVYPFVIYPYLVILQGTLRPCSVKRKEYVPTVTVLIAAYNEAACIEGTVKNKLEQDYPQEKLNIMVISDGSDDGTDDIVNGIGSGRVKLIRQEPRSGKASALNLGVKSGTGDILVFSDANSIFAKDAISRLVENFADPEIGYVTGKLTYTVQGSSVSGDGCDSYMKYENWLRAIETKSGSIIGVNGGVDAIRSSLYVDIPQSQITDFVLPLSVIAQHYRVVYDQTANSYEEPNSELNEEFRMRVRVALRALQGLIYMKRLINPIKYLSASFRIISHKWLRYLTPVFMIVALITNAILAFTSTVYLLILIMHVTLYILGILGMLVELKGVVRKISYYSTYFIVSNTAFLVALYKLLKGEKVATWKPRIG